MTRSNCIMDVSGAFVAFQMFPVTFVHPPLARNVIDPPTTFTGELPGAFLLVSGTGGIGRLAGGRPGASWFALKLHPAKNSAARIPNPAMLSTTIRVVAILRSPISAQASIIPVAPVEYPGGPHRSEEHTSELQSLRHLVCRLL